MCLQFALLGQSHTIYAVLLENINRKVARHSNNHQRHEKVVTTGYLGNEEDTRQRSMHDSRHDSCHTQQSKIFLGHVDANLVHIP